MFYFINDQTAHVHATEQIDRGLDLQSNRHKYLHPSNPDTVPTLSGQLPLLSSDSINLITQHQQPGEMTVSSRRFLVFK